MLPEVPTKHNSVVRGGIIVHN
ncbi:MAG: hypothetical protein GY941_23700 [Planctomycetes bacterium]|nr:hypothetical protein [Planctomycetota bacterium]